MAAARITCRRQETVADIIVKAKSQNASEWLASGFFVANSKYDFPISCCL
jgi:hypothetical protein